MYRLLCGTSAVALFSVLSTQALAQTGDSPEASRLDEVIVTATKRSASAQDIPVTVAAIGEQQLDELGIDVFTDYLVQLPGVTAGGGGPGQSTIYIRGLASTTPNLTTAGVAGLAPNVAFYLDEQPLAQPGRNLDVYAADMERVEVLSGPQGTLFGASSQAGTVRLITNKPELYGLDAGFDTEVSFTKGGEMSNKVEAFVNIPFSDKFALRGVAFVDNQGGWIDNVPGTVNLSESARFRPEGTVRANGIPVSARRAGVQTAGSIADVLAAGDTLVGNRVPIETAISAGTVNFVDADNAQLVEDNINDTTYSGYRLSGLYEFNADWSLQASVMQQRLDTEGVFFSDPDLDDWEIQRYEDENLEDEFVNAAYKLEGRLGALEAVYAGAFTDRTSEQKVDYTDYLYVGQYLPYYICDSTVTYPEYNAYAGVSATPQGTCYAPNLFVTSSSETEVITQELRFNTPEENRLRATFGGFYSDLTLTERNDFVYPGSADPNIDVFSYFGAPTNGFSPNQPFDDAYNSDPGTFPAGTIFRNDVKRTDTQMGLFGEATYELVPDTFAVTIGARYYDVEVDLEGGANASFCNGFLPDQDAFGTNISDLYDGDGQFTFIGDCSAAARLTFTQGQTFDEIRAQLLAADPYSVGRGAFVNAPNAISDAEIQAIVNALDAPDKAQSDGVILKANAQWTPTSDLLFYATYSEGFRPGLLNRPGGAPGPNGYTVPFELQTDEVQNYELGWKTDLFDNSLRFNGSIFYVEVQGLQTTIFDPSISNLFFSDNAANAELMGLEGNFTWAPYSVDGLTVAGGFSFLDTEVTEVLIPTDDVQVGSELAFAPSFQGNLRARYEWELDQQIAGSALTAHIMPQVVFSDESFTDIIQINRMKLDGYTTVGATLGVTADQWSAELFVNNLTNEHAEISGNFVFDRERVVATRPRTIGARFGYSFN